MEDNRVLNFSIGRGRIRENLEEFIVRNKNGRKNGKEKEKESKRNENPCVKRVEIVAS